MTTLRPLRHRTHDALHFCINEEHCVAKSSDFVLRRNAQNHQNNETLLVELCTVALFNSFCRAANSYQIPKDYVAHLEKKKVGARRGNDDVAYGNHCTIYAS